MIFEILLLILFLTLKPQFLSYGPILKSVRISPRLKPDNHYGNNQYSGLMQIIGSYASCIGVLISVEDYFEWYGDIEQCRGIS